MISALTGVIAERDGETLVIQTEGGVGPSSQLPLMSALYVTRVTSGVTEKPLASANV